MQFFAGLIALALFPSIVLAQFTQQGDKLVGTGVVGSSWQGTSAALSADGNTAIVGGSRDNNYVGATWVFTRSNGVWTQQGGKLVGADAVGESSQGNSVAISSDGNTAIVGGYSDNSGTGAAWIYTRSNGAWTQQGNKLVGSGATGPADQGVSVSISSDGNTAIVGGAANSSSHGAAWIFTRTAGVWHQQGGKLVGTASDDDAELGFSVAMSGDGNTAIVGGWMDNNRAGAAWVFTRAAGVWSQQGNKLVATDAIGAAQQGCSVALSSDGNTAIIGGNTDSLDYGAAWIFTRASGVWTQQGHKLYPNDAAGAPNMGSAVSLSSDGNTALVGGWFDGGGSGAGWIF